ncbi:MAG: type IV pilus assembly protein PilM [Candidatus Paceibacterota bacterium]|jgi:type IV pilus assembly protein PilM
MANFFSSLFSSLVAKSSPSVLGIDIGDSSIKVVQIKKRGGKAILETYGELALGPYAGFEVGQAVKLAPEKLSQALLDVLKEANVTTKNCGMSIPLGSTLITFIKMPASIDEKQLNVMIPIEARKYIPVPISEVNLNWWVIPKDDVSVSETGEAEGEIKDKSVDVLLVAVHTDAIERNKQVVQSTGLQSSFSEVELFSTVRASLEQSMVPQMLFDMGSSLTKLYIIERGILRASHTINRGSQDITQAISKSMSIPISEAEQMKRTYGIIAGQGNQQSVVEVSSPTLDYIFAEASRVLLGYQRKYNKNIGRVVLSGSGVLLKGLAELAKSTFQTEVVVADPFGKVEYPAFLANVLKDAGPGFAVALGLALRKLQEL